MKNLQPFGVFSNLKILNLPYNKIVKIDDLEPLKSLKILDLRFNQISKLPKWLFDLNLPLYWERGENREEGVFLEGNPLPKGFSEKLKNQKIESSRVPVEEEKKVTTLQFNTKLQTLNTQHLLLFTSQSTNSSFLDDFVPNREYVFYDKSNLRLNISIVEYDESDKILNSKQQVFRDINYIILVLKESECCLHPHLLSSLSEEYLDSNIFLVMENSQENISSKISFFKQYNESYNILDIFHSNSQESNEKIKEDIFIHIKDSDEPKSLWKESWIALKNEIEEKGKSDITFDEYMILAKKHGLEEEVEEEIFIYLKRVGVIKEYLS